MARHFKRKSDNGRNLRLLLLLLIAAAAVFGVGRLLTVAPTDVPTPLSADLTAQAPTAPDETPDAQPLSSDAVAEPPQAEKEPKAHAVLPDVRYAPPSGEKPILAIIVDDGGNQLELTKRVAGISIPLTWAILPYTRFAAETAQLADAKKIPYLLHLPMQAQSDKDGSKEYIVGRGMSAEQISSVTAKALDSLPGAIGLNNHRGSLATSSREIVDPVIAVLKGRGQMFVDSRTSEKSVAYDAARANGVAALRNRGFLDGSAEKSEIEKRFAEALRLAEKRGDAIVICHFRPSTVDFLELLFLRRDTLPVRLVTIPEMAALLKVKGD